MSNLNELFPGLEAYDDINVDIDTTGSSDTAADTEPEIVANSETAAQAEEIAADGEKEEAKSELFVRQFTDLCDMQNHIATYGVDRTFLSLCNKGNVLGRALRIQMPAMESFDTVGSPASPVSIACVEALDDSLWQKFKDWVRKIWYAIKNFFTKIIDWFKGATGNYELRFGKLKQWYKNATKDGALEGKKLDSVKDTEVYGLQNFETIITKIDKMAAKLGTDKIMTEAKTVVGAICSNIGTKLTTHLKEVKVKGSKATEYRSYDSYDQQANDTDIEGKDVLSKTEQEKLDNLMDKIKDYKKDVKKAIDDLKALTIKSERDINNCIETIDDALGNNSLLERLITELRDYQRLEEQFKLSTDQTMQRMNQDIQRTEGSSMGAKYRAKLTRAISQANKLVFGAGALPFTDTAVINAYFKLLSGCRKCVKDSGGAETTV